MIRRPDEMAIDVREDMRGGKGKVTIQHFFKKDELKSNTRLCSRLTLPPGTSIGMHQHESEEEVFIITKGSGLMDDGQTQTPVSTGDAILTGDGASHAISNNGSDNLEIIASIMCY